MLRILVTDPIDETGLERLRAAEDVTVDVRTSLSPEELRRTIGNYEGLIVRSTTRVTRDVIYAGARLRVIGRSGVGLDNIDCGAASERHISVVNTPGAPAVAVAELAIGLMLAVAHRIVTGTVGLRGGLWEKSNLEGRELFGKTLGLVGLGRTGKEVARRARAFGMLVLGCRNPRRRAPQDPDLVYWGVSCVPLDELLATADVLSLHVPLTPATESMIGADQLARMKPGAMLINCARGGLVDEAALYQALKSGHLGGAGLDVFAAEPPTGSPLLTLENVVATPHLGASATEAQTRASVEVADRVLEVLFSRRQVER